MAEWSLVDEYSEDDAQIGFYAALSQHGSKIVSLREKETTDINQKCSLCPNIVTDRGTDRDTKTSRRNVNGRRISDVRAKDEYLHSLKKGYHVMPLEKYMRISKTSRRERLFKEVVRLSLRLVFKVERVFNNTVSGQLVELHNVRSRYVVDLNIKVQCQLPDNKQIDTDVLKDDESDFEKDDYIKGAVTSIISHSEIHVSLVRRLDDYEVKNILVKLRKENLISKRTNNSSSSDNSDSEDFVNKHGYLDDLRICPSFSNPASVQNFSTHLGINTSLKRASFCPKCLQEESVEDIRDRQSYKWSMRMVGVGVKYFKSNETAQAKKCFDQAIQFHPKNVEALVARGALKANNNELRDATADFKEALTINPNHKNGRKYLIETSMTHAKSCEKNKEWKQARECYHNVLCVDREHLSALEKIQMIKEIISRKSITPATRSVSAASASPLVDLTSDRKADSNKDKIHTLKNFIEQKLSKQTSLNEEEKKKRRQRSKYSSTSSSSSCSSSSTFPSPVGKNEHTDRGEEHWEEAPSCTHNIQDNDEWIEKEEKKNRKSSTKSTHQNSHKKLKMKQ